MHEERTSENKTDRMMAKNYANVDLHTKSRSLSLALLLLLLWKKCEEILLTERIWHHKYIDIHHFNVRQYLEYEIFKYELRSNILENLCASSKKE